MIESNATEVRGTGRTGEESLSECVIELEGRHSKLRIQLKDASASYLAKLSRELWGSAS